MKQVLKGLLQLLAVMFLPAGIFLTCAWVIDFLGVEFALKRACWVYFHFFIIAIIYFIVKVGVVPINRKGSLKVADKSEKALFYLSTLLFPIGVVLVVFILYPVVFLDTDTTLWNKEAYTNVIFIILVTVPPYFFGIYDGLKENAKSIIEENRAKEKELKDEIKRIERFRETGKLEID